LNVFLLLGLGVRGREGDTQEDRPSEGGRGDGRMGEREEGKKGGREEGRKEGRKEGECRKGVRGGEMKGKRKEVR